MNNNNMTHEERIAQLEQTILTLQAKIASIDDESQNKFITPVSVGGGQDARPTIRNVDTKIGLGRRSGNGVAWNDTELLNPSIASEPPLPKVGYNKHSHSRFSGGALIKDMLEIVEYVWGAITNKDSQSYWQTQPEIATEQNSNQETVLKIGKLDLVFNPDGGYDGDGNPIGKWGVAAYEIDIEKCYLVQHDVDGTVLTDSNGTPMKSPLFDEDITKTSVIWDKNAKCFRFFSVYAPGA